MKGATCASLMVLGVFVVFIGVASGVSTCWGDENKCAEDECCVKLGHVTGICKKLKDVDNTCQVNPLKDLIKDHVYNVMCPCADGLQCVSKDGVVGKLVGTCQEGGAEEDGTESPAE